MLPDWCSRRLRSCVNWDQNWMHNARYVGSHDLVMAAWYAPCMLPQGSWELGLLNARQVSEWQGVGGPSWYHLWLVFQTSLKAKWLQSQTWSWSTRVCSFLHLSCSRSWLSQCPGFPGCSAVMLQRFWFRVSFNASVKVPRMGSVADAGGTTWYNLDMEIYGNLWKSNIQQWNKQNKHVRVDHVADVNHLDSAEPKSHAEPKSCLSCLQLPSRGRFLRKQCYVLLLFTKNSAGTSSKQCISIISALKCAGAWTSARNWCL